MDAFDRPPVVLDCGTGYVKAGQAGSTLPSFIGPTAVSCTSTVSSKTGVHGKHLADLDYEIGEAALTNPGASSTCWPMKAGVIEDFSAMERLWTACIYKKLKVYPEDHNFILTEPPLNTPENREVTAEIFFETLNAAGLYIGVQAVLALYAGWAMAERSGSKRPAPGARELSNPLTGTVVDSGDGCTHIIPIVDGYVVGSAIRSIPLAGRDVTTHSLNMLRAGPQGALIPPQQGMEIARRFKETMCYTAADAASEGTKYSSQPDKYKRAFTFTDARTGKEVEVDVGKERYLGPEIFFNPSLYAPASIDGRVVPLPSAVDDAVQSCPIDTRRALYNNILLSGGSTMFKDFGRRVQKDVQGLVNSRLGLAGGIKATAFAGASDNANPLLSGAPQVNVVAHPLQRYAVWAGGSVLGMSPAFPDAVITREAYQEHGGNIVRNNPVFKGF